MFQSALTAAGQAAAMYGFSAPVTQTKWKLEEPYQFDEPKNIVVDSGSTLWLKAQSKVVCACLPEMVDLVDFSFGMIYNLFVCIVIQ